MKNKVEVKEKGTSYCNDPMWRRIVQAYKANYVFLLGDSC